jgi:hypothetical protein
MTEQTSQRCMYDVRGAQPCTVWCRHFAGGSQPGGTVCPWAERQDVADHGPGPFADAEPTPRGPLLGVRPGIDYVGPAEVADMPPQRVSVMGEPLQYDADEPPFDAVATLDAALDRLWDATAPALTNPLDRWAAYAEDERESEPEPEPVGEFGRAAARTLAEVRETFDTRGNTYGDTWAVDSWLAEPARLRDCKALVRVKMRRAEMTGFNHRDSLVDLIAYAAAYVTWADEMGAWS